MSKFERRFLTTQRWTLGNECLNFQNIERPPRWYNDTAQEWVQELTTFIYLYPREWQTIYQEYLYIVQERSIQGNHNLRFYTDDEGYIKIYDEEDVLLKITLSGDTDRMKEFIRKESWEEIITFDEYMKYTEMQEPERLDYLYRLRERLDLRLNAYTGIGNLKISALEFVSSPDDSSFTGHDIFIDPLNDTYFIL